MPAHEPCQDLDASIKLFLHKKLPESIGKKVGFPSDAQRNDPQGAGPRGGAPILCGRNGHSAGRCQKPVGVLKGMTVAECIIRA